jgi:hypothetical protein
MALYADRVKDSTSITGTGAITLSGTAPTGYQTFATAFGATSQTVAYCIADQTGNNWEVGTGVFNGTTGLTRVTVLASSNGGSLVNFTGGTQDVFCTAPAKYLDIFTSTNQGVVPASGGGTANFLRADGNFAAPPTTAPAGSNTQIQFNSSSAFGATAGFSYNTSTYTFNIAPANIGTVIIEPVAPTGSQTSTDINIRTKNASATNGNGGNILVAAGQSIGTGTAGRLNFSGGAASSSGRGGDVLFTSGSGGFAGNMEFSAGSGGGTNSDGGQFIMSGGLATGTGYGGGFVLQAGNAQGSGTAGGFFLTGGSANTGIGGDLSFASGGGAAGGGSIYLQTDANAAMMTIAQTLAGVGQIGFFNATPVTKPIVTGSRATGAALVSLLTQLAALGLITNSTTA